jgi:aryl-alcohol dehydrogenase-like predicted oxidoreductase
MSIVAQNYSISNGPVRTVGVRSPEQAQQIVEALGWRISEGEVERIDKVKFEWTGNSAMAVGFKEKKHDVRFC